MKPHDALKGRRALIVGMANAQSIAYGCGRALRGLGAELAVTYLNDKAKPHVEPLAREARRENFLRLIEHLRRESSATPSAGGAMPG